MTGFPRIYGKIRQVFHVPFTKLYVFGIVHGNFASTLLVTEQIVHFSIVHHHPGTGHGNHLGSSPFERERGLAFGNLSVVPVHAIMPNDAVLAIMLSDEQYNNLLVVTDQKGFERSCSIGLDAIKNKDWAIGKYYFNEKEKVLLEQFYELKTQFESTKSKIIFDMDHSAEGGRGNAMALKQLGLSEVITSWSKDEDVSYDLVNRKDFENPETDFNKIISASRWYFNTGDGTNFGLVTHGYRFYDFGKVEPDKKYYGKLTPDVTYSRLYTKEPITILDKLYQHTKKTIPNPNELLSAGINQSSNVF
jgi:hypothetical protein